MFTIHNCPVCNDWSLEVPHDTQITWEGWNAKIISSDEINGFLLEHIYECFGVPVELQLAS